MALPNFPRPMLSLPPPMLPPTEPTPPERDRPPRRLFLLVAMIAALAGAIWLTPLREVIHPTLIAAWLRGVAGEWWAPLAFVLIYTVCSLAFVPALLLAATAALLWGWALGGVIDLVAGTIAALPPFWLARSSAAGWIEQKLRRRLGINYDRFRVNVTSTLFLVRLVPVLPFSAVNYLAGLAGVRPSPYIVATAIGMTPSAFIFTYLVDSAARGELSLIEMGVRVALAGLAFAVLFLLGRVWLIRRHRARMRRR